MFKCVTNVSDISHHIISAFVKDKDIAIDATLGNGHDTDFLKDNFKMVYAFDIQQVAVNNYNAKNYKNVKAICDSHENFEEYINGKVNCLVYNLGYLPGENKDITTISEVTVKSIRTGLNMLCENGIMTIAIYSGHEEGKKEKNMVLDFVKSLPKNKFAVLYNEFLNRDNNPPSLVIIEKK